VSWPTPPDRPARYGTLRNPKRRTLGGALDQVASVLGWMLYPWQREVGDTSLEVDPITKALWYRTVGVSVARQNGKTLLVICRVALEMIRRPRRTVVYTAQDRNMARRQWEAHCDLLVSRPAFAAEVRPHGYVKSNGRECLTLRNGSRYLIVTPNEGAGRSLSVDLAIIDEAYAQTSMALVGALTPTMVTRPSAQLWLCSNAGSADSMLFRHYTDVGRLAVDNPKARTCWHEWTCDPEASLLDAESWADANPALGFPGGPLVGALEAELLEVGEDVFRREHLNQWPGDGASSGFDVVAWAACADPASAPGDLVYLGLDITPERDGGTLVAAGEPDDRTPVEVLEQSTNLEYLILRTIDVAKRQKATIVIDRGSPAGSWIPALERAGCTVQVIPGTELANACGDFYDAVIYARLSHQSDPRLSESVVGATRRKLGDKWVWDRRAGADITALVAATLARWGILTGRRIPAPNVH
jgi:hypothetical protein